MAKKMNPFAADFEGLNKSADDKVFAMLKSAEKENEAAPKPPATMKTHEEKMTTLLENKKKQEPKNSQKATKKKSVKSTSVTGWGRPVAHFNTRIPEKMSELLDDLVYKLRKQGRQKTKQELAQEAIEDLLSKHRVIGQLQPVSISETSSDERA